MFFRPLPRHNGGFTVTEVMVAMAVSITLGSIVFAVVAGTMRVSATTETRAAAQAHSATVLDDFTNTVDYTDYVSTATASVLTVETRDATRCYRHTYRFAADPINLGKLELTYDRSSVGVPITGDCSLVADALDGGMGGYAFVYAIGNLAPSSGFRYFDLSGARTYRPGEPNFSTLTAVHPCSLGRVEMVLDKTLITPEDTRTITDAAVAHFRGNTRGTGGC